MNLFIFIVSFVERANFFYKFVNFYLLTDKINKIYLNILPVEMKWEPEKSFSDNSLDFVIFFDTEK